MVRTSTAMITLLGLVFYQSSAIDMDNESSNKLWLSGGYQKQLTTDIFRLDKLDQEIIESLSEDLNIPVKLVKKMFIPTSNSESHSYLGVGSEYAIDEKLSITARAQIHPSRSYLPFDTSPNIYVSLLGNVMLDQGFFSLGLGTYHQKSSVDLHTQHFRITYTNFMPKVIFGAGILISDTMMLNMESSFSNINFRNCSYYNEFETSESLHEINMQIETAIKPINEVLLDASIALSYNLNKLQD